MGYNPSTKIITAPVSVADIQKALSRNIKDVKTLCLLSDVNMLSKFKPTSARGIFVHEDEDKWWQGMSVGTDTYDTPQHYLNKMLDILVNVEAAIRSSIVPEESDGAEE